MSDRRQVIVVFGCPVGAGGVISPALERRLVRAHEEVERDPQALVVVSGGVVRGEVEAAFMQQWLVARGVPADRIRVEPSARDTEENAALVAELLRAEAISGVRLVTDRFHMRRSRWLLALALRRVSGARVPVVEAAARDDKAWLERLGLGFDEAWKLAWSLCQLLWRRTLRR